MKIFKIKVDLYTLAMYFLFIVMAEFFLYILTIHPNMCTSQVQKIPCNSLYIIGPRKKNVSISKCLPCSSLHCVLMFYHT